MNLVQVTFRNMPSSSAIEALVQEKAAWLQRFFPRIQSCRVVVAMASHRAGKGTVYHVRVDLTVPGAELVTTHDPAATPHEDAYIAVRDAFDVMRRELQQHAQRIRGDVKHHEAPPPEAAAAAEASAEAASAEAASAEAAPAEAAVSRPPRQRSG